MRFVLISLGMCFMYLSAVDARANQCAMQALAETKAAGGNQSRLKSIYNTYFGEDLARTPVAKRWKDMDSTARKAQTDRSRQVVVSLASKLAKYANATFTWKGNSATFRLGKESGRITVTMSGNGCRMSNVCIKDIGCLASYIGDAKKLAKND